MAQVLEISNLPPPFLALHLAAFLRGSSPEFLQTFEAIRIRFRPFRGRRRIGNFFKINKLLHRAIDPPPRQLFNFAGGAPEAGAAEQMAGANRIPFRWWQWLEHTRAI